MKGGHHNYWPYGERKDMVALSEDDDGNLVDGAELWEAIATGKVNVNDDCIGRGNVLVPILAYAIACRMQKTAVKLLEMGANPHVWFELRPSNGDNCFDSPISMAIWKDCEDVLRALMDMGFSTQSTCKTETRWVDADDDDEEGWKEEHTSVLEYALAHGTYEVLRCILAYKHTPVEVLEHHRDKLWMFDPCVGILNEAIAANIALEAAWCTAWMTYGVLRGPWRHLCPMIVERMVVTGMEEESEKEEPVSKKIKV